MRETPSFEGANMEGAIENKEKLTFHFTYVDHSKEKHPIIFECDANSITEADIMYEAKLGEKPERQNHVGCSLVRN